jgi:uncharacterized protein (TIGR02145 family)
MFSMKRIVPHLVLICFLIGIATIESCKKEPVIPTLTTTAVSNITVNSVTSGGAITKDGGAGVTARGICWGTSAMPAVAGSHTSDGTGIGSFVSDLTDLTPNTLYHIRAYATNKAGTAYGADISFTTTPIVVPTLTTADVTSITLSTAVSGGNITADGNAAITAKGVCWDTISAPTVSGSKTSDGIGIGSFISSVTGLLPGTLYHVRAYATNSAGTGYGSDVTFTTTAVGVPTLTTTVVTSITQTTAVSGGNITSDGGGTVTARGICWATTSSPTLSNFKTSDASGTGSFVSNLIGLTSGTTYYVRAYATNSAGTAYGNEVSFTALQIVIPTLTTTVITSITTTTAVSGGNVLTDGSGTVTGRGVCWALTATPTISNSLTSDATGTGSYVSNITGLLPGTTYHVRAYAVNSAGPAYGNELTFTTLVALPTITTTAATSITQTTAVAGGNVTADGGGTITARGTCWALTSNPTIAGSKTSETGTTGIFVSNLTPLLPGSIYHIRAYATNSAGTAYGSDLTFTTLVSLPTVTTTAATSIAQKTAVAGGNVTADGGGSIIAAGTCWAITANPTIANSKTTDATATGSFVSNLTGLDAGTLYHIRAYATNSAGTSYGSDLTFTTVNPTPPAVTTAVVSPASITDVAAVSGGSITDDGNGIISAKGVCWSTSTAPDLTNSKTNEGGGTASFVSNLGPLLPGTTYYVRAYATNSLGTTSYGNEYSFNTKVADGDGNLYTYVVVNSQVWLTEDLKTTKYSDGSGVPLVTDNSAWAALAAPGYCWYNNDIANKPTYGAIYNWYAVDAASNGGKNVCPALWHVATEAEWESLITFVGGPTVAGGILKEAGTVHWTVDNGTNTVGFTALPGGERVWSDGGFAELGTDSYHWTSTEDEYLSTNGWGQGMTTTTIATVKGGYPKVAGASVRCLKN